MARKGAENGNKLIEFAATLFDSAGKSLGATGAMRPFAAFSKAISRRGPDFQELDPTATAKLTNATGAAARRIDTLSRKLSGVPNPPAQQVFDLMTSLEAFNSPLLQGARSMCVKDIPARRRKAVERAVRDHYMDAGNPGFEIHQAARLLRGGWVCRQVRRSTIRRGTRVAVAGVRSKL